MSIRGRIITMVVLLEVILMITAGVLVFQEHLKREDEVLFYIETSLKNHFLRSANEIDKRYSSRIAGFVRSNPNIVTAFIHGDRETLDRLLSEKIKTLHKEDAFFEGISFAYKDGTIFYHSGNPARIGRNVLHVPFARQSLEAQKPLGGLVLSLSGLAYRYSYPVFSENGYVGIIVLIIQPTKAMSLLRDDFNAESGILVEKGFVDRFENREVTYVGNQILIAAQGDSFNDQDFLEKLPQGTAVEEFKVHGQTYRKFTTLPLRNYRGNGIGNVVTVLNITERCQEFRRSWIKALIIFGSVFLLTVLVLFMGINFFLKQVKRLQSGLESKVAQRTAALQDLNEKLSEEILERERAQQLLQELSERDVLTGIYNRRKFNDYYDVEWSAAKRERRPLSLLMIDIDFFKIYNDRYGHLAGDEALTMVAKGIDACVRRPRDFVARYGGEEFVCLLPEMCQDAAHAMAEKIRQHIEELHYIHEFSQAANVITVSIGVASLIPTEQQAKEELIDQADKALYLAKKKGRNCSEVI
nr:diguanylate cyclase [uncultured Desulfuromonas sp.]